MSKYAVIIVVDDFITNKTINIKKELEVTLKKHRAENKLLEAQRLEERTKFENQ